MKVVTPDHLFSLSPAHIVLHVLVVAATISVIGAFILRFALRKGAKVQMGYGRAYLLNFLLSLIILLCEVMFVYRVVHHTILTPSDFIGPGNWFAILLAIGFSLVVPTIFLGFMVKRPDGRRIGTTASLAVALIYACIYVPIGLGYRALYFWVLQQQGALGG
ncbi:hypothetical protein [Desulfarculus baarsii]